MLPRIRCPPSTIYGLANVSGLELGYDLGLVCLGTYVPSIRRPRFSDFLPLVKSVPIWCYESPLNANFCFYHKNRKLETIPPPPTRRPHNPNLHRRRQQMHLQRRTPPPPSPPPPPPLTPPPSQHTGTCQYTTNCPNAISFRGACPNGIPPPPPPPKTPHPTD